jgi:hypothetical protein
VRDSDIDTEPLTKDQVEAGHAPVFPVSMPMWVALAYALTHPFHLVRASIAIAFGIICLAVFWGFMAHAMVDAWNFAWNLWGSI